MRVLFWRMRICRSILWQTRSAMKIRCSLQKCSSIISVCRPSSFVKEKSAFNWIVWICCFVRCFEVCRTSKLPLSKDLICFVRGCCLCELIQDLENLGASRKENGFILFALCKKNQKAHQRFANLWTPGSDSKLCRKRFCKVFRRLVPKPVLPAKRRRKGFESMRKGDYTADARPLFFEKELFYCKLTVGCRG